ncbi:unnamed protein product [Musa acuminata subsp. burmannicoides]|uniref:(wild Malaysian banana) hypothetical protein n=1 Tax=Musa acuminata subsp. malaccensis TaxID=214687 RepID=A0A804LBJ5_MUSAM|nr:PREDICTED: uncharacterized protein LOC103972469 [Musa acuminata subsp. malaccensis]CAG1865567.1 unnamed protein product [Musa acuminata subsp. malaccensis]
MPGEGEGEASDRALGWQGRVEDEWRRIKEHAETYPYVWGSYILVYGSLSAYLAYRWRKLRRTEDRVRTLRERLRTLVEAEGSAAAAGTAGSAAPSMPNKSRGPS